MLVLFHPKVHILLEDAVMDLCSYLRVEVKASIDLPFAFLMVTREVILPVFECSKMKKD